MRECAAVAGVVCCVRTVRAQGYSRNHKDDSEHARKKCDPTRGFDVVFLPGGWMNVFIPKI
jgi:hypothetical protein